LEKTTIREISKWDGEEVEISGWVYNKRSSGKIHFLLIRDGTGIIQGVAVKKEVPEEVFNSFNELTQESSIIVTGKVRADKRAPGGYELTLTGLKTIQIAEPFPITPKEHGIDYLMEHRHLWLRSKKQHAVMLVRHEIIKSCRNFLDDSGFILMDTPILTPSACEGTTTLFETKYFESSAYLAQSGQLYNEANCMAHRKVYCFGPTFRAENSNTSRHLAEFWMVEPEMAFCDLNGDIELAKSFLNFLFRHVLLNCREDMEFFNRFIDNTVIKTLEDLVEQDFEHITYTEAVDILTRSRETFEFPVKWGTDIQSEHERYLCEKVFQKPVVLTDFPKEIKAFYMKANEDGKTVRAMDVLVPRIGEIIGGSQREDDYEKLRRRIEESNLSVEAYWWYLELRKFGSAPHAGFGLGFERLLQFVTGMANIRDVIPFPRTPGNLSF